MKALVWGFLFGTVGLFILAAAALIYGPLEKLGDWLFIPGRYLAEKFAGQVGSDAEVMALTVASGIFYAVLFFILARIFRR